MMRCYISRVENGHTVPSLDTLNRIAKALETELAEMLRDGVMPVQTGGLTDEQEFLRELRAYLPMLSVRDKEQILDMVRRMVET